MLQMAQIWQRLADELAGATEQLVEGTPPPATEAARPPAQQQQQVQPKDEKE